MRLPILATVRGTYRFVFAHPGTLGSLARWWAGAAGAAFVVSWLLVRQALEAQSGQSFARTSNVGEQVAAATSLSAMIAAIAAYVIVVRWHRMIVQASFLSCAYVFFVIRGRTDNNGAHL